MEQDKTGTSSQLPGLILYLTWLILVSKWEMLEHDQQQMRYIFLILEANQ